MSPPVQHHVGPVAGSMMNGYCYESEVSGPLSCNGQLNVELCPDDCLEQRNCLPSSTSVDPAPVSSQVSQTLPVDASLTISSGACESVSSVERNSSVPDAAAEKNEHVASHCGEVAKDSELLNHDAAVPEARLMGLQSDVANESSNTDQTQQTPQHVHSSDDNYEDGKILTLSPLRRESDMLLSARKSSIDYFQKVSCLPLVSH